MAFRSAFGERKPSWINQFRFKPFQKFNATYLYDAETFPIPDAFSSLAGDSGVAFPFADKIIAQHQSR
jgi:hypothetical protein